MNITVVLKRFPEEGFIKVSQLYEVVGAINAAIDAGLGSQLDSRNITTDEIRDHSFQFSEAVFRLVEDPNERRYLCNAMVDLVICST